YPHKTLSVVEADFLDGMEYDGLYFLSRGFYNLYDGTPKGYLTAIAVHETAHQWWYAQAGNDQAMEPWLDEALCTYSERLYYEEVYPELVGWWWAFRVDFYQPEGWINGSVYDYQGFRPYVNAVYLRGARFLEDLRKTTGDQAFFAFLKDYLERNNQRQVTAREFFDILSMHTTADYQSLITKYFQPFEPTGK
ncbi:MAG: M1 family aminopeptidase, partial [Omnitrophica WOR_2 bacterium]